MREAALWKFSIVTSSNFAAMRAASSLSSSFEFIIFLFGSGIQQTEGHECSEQPEDSFRTTKQQVVSGIAGEVGQEVVGEVVAGSATDVRQLVVLTGKVLLDALRCGDWR